LRDAGGDGNINMDVRKTGFQNFDFIHLAQDGDPLRVLVNIAISIFSWTIFIYLTKLSISGLYTNE
jgi:hypothetical protein